MTWAELFAEMMQPSVLLNPVYWLVFVVWLAMAACILGPVIYIAFSCCVCIWKACRGELE